MDRPVDSALPSDPLAPVVVAQLGQSLDGRIATETGESCYINGPAALDHLHRLRSEVDAVVVGVGTVLADDPQLTVRRVSGKNPARVVIDPSGRMPITARCLSLDGARRIVIRCGAGPVPAGVEALVLPRQGAGIPPARIIAALAGLGLHRLLIEGGARTIAAFLEAGCLDRLHILVAPVILGSGRGAIDLPPIERLANALRPPTRTRLLDGGDVLFDCDLRSIRGETADGGA